MDCPKGSDSVPRRNDPGFPLSRKWPLEERGFLHRQKAPQKPTGLRSRIYGRRYARKDRKQITAPDGRSVKPDRKHVTRSIAPKTRLLGGVLNQKSISIFYKGTQLLLSIDCVYASIRFKKLHSFTNQNCATCDISDRPIYY